MTDVILHIYDVTNSGSEKTNNTIMQINQIFKDGVGLGRIFHSAVQVHGNDEWLLGFANIELEFLVALLERTQCMHIVRALYWEKLTFLSLK
ncbi:hypothetical protein P3X46_030547 [Hevea brasiliensis]|uniref:Uncharacterized protein n=1 Tax=Hevea brasiliensis TaxID=3981 RepID=A0ABQ9KJ56_HEVBR|nr:hypothetical protein P3X46_030547 [Hevea brasiliensis]